jgi:arsenate reductase
VNAPVRILILCTGNSCRSQMAEGILRDIDPRLDVHSAGTQPASRVHPGAVSAMREIGLDISAARPKRVDAFVHQPFDFVITVCDNARESCPVFTGGGTRRLHIGFDDPADARGTEEEVAAVFRRVRDEIGRDFRTFYDAEVRSLVRVYPPGPAA